ncbi:MAG: hypothetical protein WC977_11410 [Anaerovoracaceae bacterium]
MAYADNKPRTVFAAGPQFHIALTGAVYAGDLIGDSSGWVQADADAGTAIPAYLVALEDGEAGDTISATNMAVITSVSGATATNPVYCSGTAGETTETDPSNGDTQVVGVSLSATSILVAPGLYATPAVS